MCSYAVLINIILIILTILTLIIYFYLTCNYNYWKKRKIPFVRPSFAFGNIKDQILMRKSFCDVFNEIYKNFEECRYVGFYLWRKPALFIRDPEIIKMVWSKNFLNFYNNTWYLSENVDPCFSKTPFFENDQKWKELRSQITPALSPGKIKMLFPAILEGIDALVTHIKQLPIDKQNEINLKELCSKYTTEVVGHALYGVKSHAFKNPNSEFLNIGKLIFRSSLSTSIESILMMCSTPLACIFKAKIISKKVFDFFINFTKEVTEYRKTNNIFRNDYFDHLLNLRQTCNDYKEDKNIARQLITVFFDAVDTTSSGIVIAIFEIIRHPDVYKKLRTEIDTVLQKYGKITFEAIQDMSYLDMCISEAFRLNPPLYFSIRDCTAPIEFPNPKDKNGKNLLVEPGITIIVPMYQIQRDPKYFPDPDDFIPERFSKEQKNEIPRDTYFPFGDGPRMCLGKNYAVAVMKPFIVTMVQNFDITFKSNTKYTLKPNVGAMLNVILFNEIFWLSISKRGEVYPD